MLLKRNAIRQGANLKLSPTQHQVLLMLSLHPPGSLTPKKVASHLGLKLPSVSRSISTLSEKQLVFKVVDPSDTRSVRLELTEAGRAEAEVEAAWPAALIEAIDTLSPDERAAMIRTLIKVIRHLQENGEVPAQRMCVDCVHFRPNAHDDPQQPHHCELVGAPFGDSELRLDCAEQAFAAENDRQQRWQVFVNGRAIGDAS